LTLPQMKQTGQKRTRRDGKPSDYVTTLEARNERLEREQEETLGKLTMMNESREEVSGRETAANAAVQMLKAEQQDALKTQKALRADLLVQRLQVIGSANQLWELQSVLAVQDVALQRYVRLTGELQAAATATTKEKTVADTTVAMLTQEREGLRTRLRETREMVREREIDLERAQAESRDLRRTLKEEREKSGQE
jgi:chromosome segregation ATPase